MTMTWRVYFDIPFVLMMIGPIALIVHYWVSRQLRGVDADRAASVRDALRAKMRRLDIVWLGALAFGLVWGVLTMLGREPFGAEVNVPVLLGVVGFHAIWWPLAMPILRQLDTLLEEADVLEPLQPNTPTRSARLQVRHVSDYLPGFAIPMAIALGLFGPLALAVWILSQPLNEPRFLAMTLTFAGAGVLTLLLMFPLLRTCISARVVLAPGQDPAEADRLRRYRVRWGYGSGVGVSMIMMATAAVTVLVDRGLVAERAFAIVGGTTGCLFGLLGGFIGIRGSFREYQLRRKNTADSTNSTTTP